ncbi:uncharacterized protein [Henckelia pumila]|uniref:uncharacterized protein n=1 Tax=Henckelia pumila TaxID=405737 RepID=UPI003C6E9B0B
MSMLDAASGRVFVDKTAQAARNLIDNMTANSQQFGTNRRNGQNVKKCGICAEMGHSTDMYPILQEETVEQVNATGGFPEPPHQKYDSYSNTYNPGCKDNPNLRYGNPPETRASIQHLNTQVGQLAIAVNRLEAKHSNSLPSQTVLNPKENVSAITLRSGRELKVNEKVVQNEDVKESKVEENDLNHEDTPRGMFPPLFEYKHVAPFPLALKKSRKDEGIKGLYETFLRCEINIPLLDDIKQVPRYAKFLKELCAAKRQHNLKRCKKVELEEQVSLLIRRKTPEKCKDPGMFSIPCKIEDVHLDTDMLDLGASINVLPYSVYTSLKLRPLNETATVIQMADRSTIYPRGVIEDVLVQFGNLIFSADFYMLDMKNNDLKSPIFLGRPFLKTSNSVNNLDINDYLSQEHKKVVNECKLKEAPEAEEPRISRKSKKRPKLTVKVLKWVKNRVPPPPQSKFQYDFSVIPSDIEEDDTTNT